MTMPNGLPSGANIGVATRSVGTCGVSIASVVVVQIERRDVDFAAGELDRFLEVAAIALRLQLLVRERSGPLRSVPSGRRGRFRVPSSSTPMNAKHRVGRLGVEIGRKRDCATVRARSFRRCRRRIDPARLEMRADQSVQRRRANERSRRRRARSPT